jgi:hypothetical protein
LKRESISCMEEMTKSSTRNLKRRERWVLCTTITEYIVRTPPEVGKGRSEVDSPTRMIVTRRKRRKRQR